MKERRVSSSWLTQYWLRIIAEKLMVCVIVCRSGKSQNEIE